MRGRRGCWLGPGRMSMRVAVEAAAVVDVEEVVDGAVVDVVVVVVVVVGEVEAGEEGLEGGEADFLACHCRDPMSI
jgi:hypothetical protein